MVCYVYRQLDMELDMPGVWLQCFGKAYHLSKHQSVTFKREIIVSGRSGTGDARIEKSKEQ